MEGGLGFWGFFYFKLQICPHLITWRVEHNQKIMTIINVFIFQHNENFPMFLRFFLKFQNKEDFTVIYI